MSTSVAAAILGPSLTIARMPFIPVAAIAQLGERQTEDLKVPGLSRVSAFAVVVMIR